MNRRAFIAGLMASAAVPAVPQLLPAAVPQFSVYVGEYNGIVFRAIDEARHGLSDTGVSPWMKRLMVSWTDLPDDDDDPEDDHGFC